ncbi:neuronal acetylcholine receptor subunit alpha-10-like [Glandiceps talaboti]
MGDHRGLHPRVRLVKDLMENYSKYLRPVLNDSDVTMVTFGILISQIIEMDEVNQKFTMNVWLRQRWVDEFLTWNASDYGDVTLIRLPSDIVWRPDIILYNNVDEEFSRIEKTNVMISNTGKIVWNAPAIFKGSCTVNLHTFPFDTQTCIMKFGSWTYDGFAIDLESDFGEADLSGYVTNGEWDLLRAPAKRNVIYYNCCPEPYPDMTFTIVMKRRPLFYVINIMIPNTFIAMLTLVGFYLPPESGEKVTLMMTNLLSLIVFQQLVNTTMPPTSDTPILGQYFIGMIIMVAFSVFVTVIVLNVYHREARQIPDGVRTVIFDFLAPLVCLSNKKTVHSRSGPRNKNIIIDDKRETTRKHVDSSPIDHSDVGMNGTQEQETICCIMDNGGFVIENSTMMQDLQKRRNTGPNLARGNATRRRVPEDRLEKILQCVEFLSRRMKEKDQRHKLSREWQDVAHVIDRTLMWICLLYTAAITAIMFLQAQEFI